MVTAEMKALRTSRDWSQREVAERVGWNPETYRLKEVGKIGITGAELAQLARVYEVPIRDAFPSWEPTEGERMLAEELGEVA
jgi:transcriptional regulator with XRE-family HTH domain